MDFLLILNAITCIVFLLIIFLKFFAKGRETKLKSNNSQFFLLFSCILFLIPLFEWIFGFEVYNRLDFLSLFSLILVIHLMFLVFAFYKIFGMRQFKYFAFFIAIIFLSCMFSSDNSFVILSLLSHLSFLILSFLLINHQAFRNTAIIGIVYSCLSLLMFILTYFSIIHEALYSFLSNLAFFIFIYSFYKSLPFYKNKEYKSSFSDNNLFLFIKYFVFIIIVINIVLLSTLVIHEFGHVFVSRMNNCDYRTVFFEGDSPPYTQVLCVDDDLKRIFLIGGVALPLVLAVLLFFMGGKLSRSVALFMAGFNMIISVRDYSDLGFSNSAIFSQIYIGAIVALIGLFLLARSKFDDNNIL